jgi:hypothetical protein
MNLGGAFFGSFPTAGALSRTVLQDATGGQTQLVGFFSSGIVILVILFLGFLFGPLPNVTRSPGTECYRRFDDSTSDISSGSSFSKSPSPEKEGEPGGSEGEGEGEGELPYHTIVIDCAPIGFADSMGITVLEQVCMDMRH